MSNLTTRIETNCFKTLKQAIAYYRVQNILELEVRTKILTGEIAIGLGKVNLKLYIPGSVLETTYEGRIYVLSPEVEPVNTLNAQTAQNFFFLEENKIYYSWRRNGKTKTWKKNPERFAIPVKYGLKTYSTITEDTLNIWVYKV